MLHDPSGDSRLHRVLRFRNLLVRQEVLLKNKISWLLMEVGAPYSKSRLHGHTYFHDLLGRLDDVPDFVIDILIVSRMSLVSFTKMKRHLLSLLRHNGFIRERVKRLMTIPGILCNPRFRSSIHGSIFSCQRVIECLATVSVGLGADVVRSTLIVWNSHQLLFAGFTGVTESGFNKVRFGAC